MSRAKTIIFLLLVIAIFILPVGLMGEAPAESLSTPALHRYFKAEHKNVLVVLIIFGFFFFYFLRRARRGKSLFMRTIPGLKALEEAVGRATEMGKPVLYVPGIDDIDEIQTLASLNILPYVAEMTAKYGAPLIVPTRRSVVMSFAEEIVKEAHIRVGRPETFRPGDIRYLSDDQFAFTCAVDGIMLREKPAANIYLGAFYAESLILSETGFLSGAIQIAGTASIAQLPFFIAACDYTLIGEEFYAASAYLSQEPSLLAGIKASDYLKIIIFFLIIGGVLSASFELQTLVDLIKAWF